MCITDIGEEDNNDQILKPEEASLTEEGEEGNAVENNEYGCCRIRYASSTTASNAVALSLLFIDIPPPKGRCKANTASPRFKSKSRATRSVSKREHSGPYSQ